MSIVVLGLNEYEYNKDGWRWRNSRKKMKKRKEKSCDNGSLVDSMVLHNLRVYFVLKWSKG